MNELTLRVGDRVSAVRLGYGPDAGQRFTGTVRVAFNYGRAYARIEFDDGFVDFGFVDLFRDLRLE